MAWFPLIALSLLVLWLRFGSQVRKWAIAAAGRLMGEVLAAHGTKTLFNGQSTRQARARPFKITRRQTPREKFLRGVRP